MSESRQRNWAVDIKLLDLSFVRAKTAFSVLEHYKKDPKSSSNSHASLNDSIDRYNEKRNKMIQEYGASYIHDYPAITA